MKIVAPHSLNIALFTHTVSYNSLVKDFTPSLTYLFRKDEYGGGGNPFQTF